MREMTIRGFEVRDLVCEMNKNEGCVFQSTETSSKVHTSEMFTWALG